MRTTTPYGSCPCGGVYEAILVEVRMTVDGTPVVLEDIPQGKCLECDSRVYRADVVEALETLMRGGPPPVLRQA